jgi:hypothetical protein
MESHPEQQGGKEFPLGVLRGHIEMMKGKLVAYGNTDHSEFEALERIYVRAERGDITIEKATELVDGVFDSKNFR